MARRARAAKAEATLPDLAPWHARYDAPTVEGDFGPESFPAEPHPAAIS